MTDDDKKFFALAAEEAKQAKCLNAKCGSVIIKDGEVIGRGYNSPPQNKESQRKCTAKRDYSKKPKYDLTCCVHAEWHAIIDACKKNGSKIEGAKLYFMRVDDEGNFTGAGQPYCTVCSRMALDAGLSEFVLWHDNEAITFDAETYNLKSYDFYN